MDNTLREVLYEGEEKKLVVFFSMFIAIGSDLVVEINVNEIDWDE